MREALEEIARLDIGSVYFGVPLKEHSWWKIGGSADLLVEPGNVLQVQTLLKALRRLNLPHVIIGDGSNILFDDAGVRGVVVKIGRRLSRVTIDDNTVLAEAGVFVPRLIRRLGSAGLTGLEHAIGIPGTLGGLVLMNGGSQQKGIGSHIERVWAVDSAGELKEYEQNACHFSYRKSTLKEAAVTVVKAQLRLKAGDSRAIRAEMLDIMRSRRSKFPLKLPNCGSVFISDPEMYKTVGSPGKVIEQCGLKGFRIGDAMIPQMHGNFIVNLGQASSKEVLKIIGYVRKEVLKKTGFLLMCEVRYISSVCCLIPAHEALEYMS